MAGGAGGRPRAAGAGLGARTVAPATAALVVIVIVAVGFRSHGVRRCPCAEPLRRTPTTASYPRVFRWLAAHTTAGQVVAADRNVESMAWVYADYGTGLLFGIPPLIAASKPNAHARDVAWDWLVGNPGGPLGLRGAQVRCRVRRRGHPAVPGYPTKYDRTRLGATPNLTLVHRDGDIEVFAITSVGRACPAS